MLCICSINESNLLTLYISVDEIQRPPPAPPPPPPPPPPQQYHRAPHTHQLDVLHSLTKWTKCFDLKLKNKILSAIHKEWAGHSGSYREREKKWADTTCQSGSDIYKYKSQHNWPIRKLLYVNLKKISWQNWAIGDIYIFFKSKRADITGQSGSYICKKKIYI